MKRAAEYAFRWFSSLAAAPRDTLRAAPSAAHDYRAWREALEPGRSPMADEAPWITFAARRALDKLLSPQAVVFEYGSGGSTLYFARRARRVITIEHEQAWLDRVRAALGAAGTGGRCQLHCIPPEPPVAQADARDLSDPDAYFSSSVEQVGRTFRAYASAIDEHPDESFDLISIDGRARPSCVAHATRKVKPGGTLLLDDSERAHYARATRELAGWERRDYFGPAPYHRFFFRTTLWRRP